MSKWLPLSVAVLLVVFAAPVAAQSSQAEHDDEHDDHHAHPNHIAVFVGATTPTKAKAETSFTLGADYERRFTDLIGVLAIADFALGDHKRTALFAANVAFHPVSGLRLAIGPGFELVEKDTITSSGAEGTKLGAYFVIRGSVLYEFHVGEWSVGPVLAVDAIGETKTNIVYGLSIGRGF